MHRRIFSGEFEERSRGQLTLLPSLAPAIPSEAAAQDASVVLQTLCHWRLQDGAPQLPAGKAPSHISQPRPQKGLTSPGLPCALAHGESRLLCRPQSTRLLSGF